jgi:hypothetical protein
MTGPFRTSVGHAFGRTAMPLAAYYGVTLALPLANGAGRSGTAFVQHAVIVLAVPPMLVLLICAIHAMVQAAARFARSSRSSRGASSISRARDVQHLAPGGST